MTAPVEVREARLFIGGEWVDAGPPIEVLNKYSGEVIGSVPTAREEDLDIAIRAAEDAAPVMMDMPAYKRAELLNNTAHLIEQHHFWRAPRAVLNPVPGADRRRHEDRQ